MKKTLAAASIFISLSCFLGLNFFAPLVWAADSSTDTSSDTSGTTGSTTQSQPLYPALGSAPSTATSTCSDVENSAGLIPCGKSINDPATSWNECDECDLCSMALAIQLTLDFLVKVVGVVTVLAIVLGQILAMSSSLGTDAMIMIKSVLGKAILGFVWVLAAWVVVNSLLTLMKYTDPIDGQWYVMC